MTRKDYVLIAESIAASERVNEDLGGDEQGHGAAVLRLVVSELATSLRADNPRFDPDRFEAAALPLYYARREAMRQPLNVEVACRTSVNDPERFYPCECLDGGHDLGTGICMCGGRINARHRLDTRADA